MHMPVPSMGLITHSEKKSPLHIQTIEWSLCVYHFIVNQLQDNGCRQARKLHLSKSAVQCSKRVVLNKLVFGDEFP